MSIMYVYYLVIIVTTILTNCGVVQVQSFPVTIRNSTNVTATVVLFEDINFRGIQGCFQLGSSCVNIQGRVNDRTSSVDPKGDCFFLYEHTNCRGRFHRTNQTIADLTIFDFNDSVSSIKRCAEIEVES